MTYSPPPNQPVQPGYGAVRGPVPGQVNTAAILLFVSGGFSLLGALLLFTVSGIAPIFAVVAVVLLVIGAVEIYVGVALRQLKQWARTAAIVIAGIGGVLSLISLIRGGYSSIVSLALDAVIIYLLTRPEVVRAF